MLVEAGKREPWELQPGDYIETPQGWAYVVCRHSIYTYVFRFPDGRECIIILHPCIAITVAREEMD